MKGGTFRVMAHTDRNNELENSYSFTLQAWNQIDRTLKSDAFQQMPTESIFRALVGGFHPVPFHEYLKRYLYLKTEMSQPFSTVPVQTYVDTILDAFQEAGVPVSFSPSTTRLRQSVTNWLTRNEVSRDTVLLLGFGLYMTPEEVNDFLTKALHTAMLDPDLPRDAICLYCYQHKYSFTKFRQLWNLYESMGDHLEQTLIEQTQPVHRAESRIIIQEDTELFSHILAFRQAPGITPLQTHIRDIYARLYQDTLKLISTNQHSTVRRKAGNPGTVEKVLSAYAPLNPHGNLVSRKDVRVLSDLARLRVSRQHIHRILSDECLPTRYDLLTLHFFQQSNMLRETDNRKTAVFQYTKSADELLADCGFGGMYPVDPFDAFLIFCMLTTDPFAAYTDVMEYAYTNLDEHETERQS